MWLRRSRRAESFEAPVLPRGARHESGRAVLQCRRCPRFHEVHESDSGDRSGPEIRARSAGRRSRFPSRSAEAHQLTFAPDPSTHNRCTIGGMIGNNSCGTHSLLGGQDGRQRRGTANSALRRHANDRRRDESDAGTRFHHSPGRTARRDLREAANDSRSSMQTSSARVFRKFPGASPVITSTNCCPREGFNVARALVGTEGTCVVVLEAKLKLIHSPQHRALVGLGYKDAFLRRRSRHGDSGISDPLASKDWKEASSMASKKKRAPHGSVSRRRRLSAR